MWVDPGRGAARSATPIVTALVAHHFQHCLVNGGEAPREKGGGALRAQYADLASSHRISVVVFLRRRKRAGAAHVRRHRASVRAMNR
jgi:hypothetical protein